MSNSNLSGSFFKLDSVSSERADSDSDYIVETFTIEYPESSAHEAKIYGNGRNSVHVRVNIGGLKKNGVAVPKEEILKHIFLFDSNSKKLIPGFFGSADQPFTLPDEFKNSPLMSQSMVAFTKASAYNTARYPSSAASEAPLASVSSDVMTLDYYVRSLSDCDETIYLSLSGYYYTSKTLPGAGSITTSANNSPPLKLSVEPKLDYRDPAVWALQSQSPATISSPAVVPHGILRENIEFFYTQHTLIYQGKGAAHEPQISSRVINNHAMHQFGMYPMSRVDKCGNADIDNEVSSDGITRTKKMYWFTPHTGVALHMSGGTYIRSTKNLSKFIQFERNFEFATFSPDGGHGVSLICVTLSVKHDKDFQLTDPQTVNTTQATIIIYDRFGHEELVRVAFDTVTGKPSTH